MGRPHPARRLPRVKAPRRVSENGFLCGERVGSRFSGGLDCCLRQKVFWGRVRSKTRRMIVESAVFHRMRRSARVGRGPRAGFALVVSLAMLLLLGLVAVGMLGLAAVELRKSGRDEPAAVARANARLALVRAIGQLQVELGPDTRISAQADLLKAGMKQPHWTGVWSSRAEDGGSLFLRDDLDGGLKDIRYGRAGGVGERARAWLVSGMADPVAGPSRERAVMLHRHADGTALEVAKEAVAGAGGKVSGHHAWWTGDLGVRAHVAVTDPWEPAVPQASGNADGGWNRVMLSQAADVSAMAGNRAPAAGEAGRLASLSSVALSEAGPEWLRRHALEVTVESRGVLADVARGGLKRDLTAYFESDGSIPGWKSLPGLADEDVVTGLDGSSRLRRVGPRFGLLRNWARQEVDFTAARESARVPQSDPQAGRGSAARALANEAPTRLEGNTVPALLPVLVEATNYIQISSFALSGFRPARYQIRHHNYPRVVLWNPYSVELDFPRAMVMIQGNGRQEMWTENEHYDNNGRVIFRSRAQWLSFEGGRSMNFNAQGMAIMNTEGYNDPYIGAYYFAIPRTRFGPGECLVFSAARAAEYDCVSPYLPGSYNLNNNELSCEVPPDPSRSYYVSGTNIGGGLTWRPVSYWLAPTPYWSQNGRFGVENQAEDTRAVMKLVGDATEVTFEDFDKLPQLAFVSASLQYGDGREPRISWAAEEIMPVEFLSETNPVATVIPNVRTREGVRLRWWDEHLSNRINSGPLSGTAHFDEALLANWNPRAAYAIRSPWENIAGSLPAAGTLGGPWFFGAYTRDLYDQAVSWQEQTPVRAGRRYQGHPFGPPQESPGPMVLFDVPRRGAGVVSLGQLQHVPLSELVWHPSYAIGNSLADPRLGLGGNRGLHRSAAVPASRSAAPNGGFHSSRLGWSGDAQRSGAREAWAEQGMAILGNLPRTDNLVYDLSFEANFALWDRFFLSTGSAARKRDFLRDPQANPLPNGRMRPAGVPVAGAAARPEDHADFHKAAACWMVEGAFNVNSTRVEAWKALLSSSRLSGLGEEGRVSFPRVLSAPGGVWTAEDSPEDGAVWAGRRELGDEEIERLAHAIVAEVRKRGPFLSLADFVNRRLAEDETGRMGALEAAIRQAGINARLTAHLPVDQSRPLPTYRHPDQISDPTQLEQTLKPESKAWGAPGWLTQADLLQSLGPVLAARSDSFVIRAYGDATDPTGRILSRAWCEAVVQRTPEPLEADETGINPAQVAGRPDFGRKFVVTRFRWLQPEEISG